MTEDYAKFDLKSPALNFTMQSGGNREISKVNHLGIEVESAEAITLWENLLTERGVISKIEENTECCFARQDKIWLQDPDGNSWEIFYVHEQLPISPKQSLCSTTNSLGKKCC